MAKKLKTTAGDKPVIVQDLVVKAPRRDLWDVGTWRSALKSADIGRTARLYDLYGDMLIDPVLGDAVDKRIGAVLNSDLTFLDAKGREVEEVSALIDTEEFEELQKILLRSILFGRSGAELGWAGDRLTVYEIPPHHLDLSGRKVLPDPNNPEKGIPYEGNPSLIVLGRDRTYGTILRAIPFAIYKRGGFGDWSQWVELFGMPQRIGKYNTYDPASKRLLEDAMERAGSASWLVIPKEADVEMHESNSGNGISFNQFRQACNEEILIALLGQTLTTISGERGARSLGEVHQEVEEAKNKADMRFLARSLNRHLLPYLERCGLPVKGGSFAYPDATEPTTVADLVQLSQLITIPKDYIHERYGIPVPDKTEEKGAVSEKGGTGQRPVLVHPAGVYPINSEPDKPSFFANALMSVQGWLGRLTSSITALTDTDAGALSFDASELISEAVRRVFGGDADEALRLLFEAGDRPMQKGLDLAFEAAEPGDEEFIDEFRYNTSVFDAFKAHQEREELIAAMTDEKGNLRSFHQFRKAAKKVTGDYNKRWLQTEYNTAVRAADNARYYREALRTKDIYPNLEYRLSLAAHRREEHEAWVGTVLPIDHPWWDTHFPPSAWNCKCTVRKTDKPVTPVPGELPTPNPELSNNPGKTASPFNLAEHPYLKGMGDPNCPECRRQGLVRGEFGVRNSELGVIGIGNNSEFRPPHSELSDGREDSLCPLHRIARLESERRKLIEERRNKYHELLADPDYTDVAFNPDTGGLKATHVGHNFDKKKGWYEKSVQDIGFNNGHEVILTEEFSNRINVKNPEGLWNGKYFEIAGAETGTKENIRKALKHAVSKPNTQVAVVFIPRTSTTANIEEGLRMFNGLRGTSQWKLFDEIYFITADGEMIIKKPT